MNDIVYALLNDNGVCAVCGYLVREALFALQSVGFVCDTVVFTQNSRAARGAANDCGMVISFVFTAEREVIGPILRCDGVPIANDGPVFLFRINGHVAEKINVMRAS